MFFIKKYRVIFIVVFAAAVCIVWTLLNAPKPEKIPLVVSTPKVPYFTVAVSDIAIPIFSRGKTSAYEVREITNEVPGLVRHVSTHLHKGSNVKKNDLLIQLDEQAFLLDVAQKQADLDLAKLEFVEIKAKAVVAQKGLKNSASEYARHIPQVRYAKSRVVAAETALAYVKNRLIKTAIRAPIDGKVINLNITEGEFINTTANIATIYGTQQLEIRLPLNDQQIEIIGFDHQPEIHSNKILDKPQVTLRDYQDIENEWFGHVTRTEGERDTNQLLYVIAKVTSQSRSANHSNNKPLLPGSFVEAEIQGQILKGVRVIPRNAEQGNKKVWVIDANDRLKSKVIEVIYRGKHNVYVSAGLKENERVATGAFHFMVEGLLVKAYPEVSTTTSTEKLASAVR